MTVGRIGAPCDPGTRTIRADRGGRLGLGNPFRMRGESNREAVCAAYECLLIRALGRYAPDAELRDIARDFGVRGGVVGGGCWVGRSHGGRVARGVCRHRLGEAAAPGLRVRASGVPCTQPGPEGEGSACERVGLEPGPLGEWRARGAPPRAGLVKVKTLSSHTWNGETQLKPCPVELSARLFRGSHMKLRFARFGRRCPGKEGSVAVIRRDDSRKGR